MIALLAACVPDPTAAQEAVYDWLDVGLPAGAFEALDRDSRSFDLLAVGDGVYGTASALAAGGFSDWSVQDSDLDFVGTAGGLALTESGGLFEYVGGDLVPVGMGPPERVVAIATDQAVTETNAAWHRVGDRWEAQTFTPAITALCSDGGVAMVGTDNGEVWSLGPFSARWKLVGVVDGPITALSCDGWLVRDEKVVWVQDWAHPNRWVEQVGRLEAPVFAVHGDLALLEDGLVCAMRDGSCDALMLAPGSPRWLGDDAVLGDEGAVVYGEVRDR